MMELTLTGGSTLADSSRPNAAVHANLANGWKGNGGGQAAAAADRQGNSTPAQPHDHGQNRGQNHGQCCGPPPPARPAKIDASTLLPTEEDTGRFRTEQNFRLNLLSSVVRGGAYELFLALVAALVPDGDGDGKAKKEAAASAEEKEEWIAKHAELESLARMLDGHAADGHTLGHWCAKRGDEPRFLSFLIGKSHAPNGARLLLDLHVPSKDQVGMYPLHWAVTEGAIPLVAMLLEHVGERPSPMWRPGPSSSSLMRGDDAPDAGIDAKDASGCTPLLIAAQYGHADLAAFLLRRGADRGAVDSSRDTALHWAAYKGSIEVCGMLLHLNGVEGQLDAQDSFGQTPLHLASLRGNVETVRFLMEEAGSVGWRGKSLDPGAAVGGVGSKAHRSSRPWLLYPGKMLAMKDKEGKTPKELAIKKKKLGCELLLQEYEERYLLPRRTLFSRIMRTCQDLLSIRNWKAWMGMGGELPMGQSPTFPFYWMVSHILMGGAFYASELVGLGGKWGDSLLWDKMGLHLFFVACWFATWANLYCVYTTNPGILAARGEGDASPSSAATCQLLCFGRGRGGYPRDKVSVEMDAVTRELRRRYDEAIESFGREFPSPESRVPLCHTCRIVKPLRSKHDRVAGRCVLLFDHHCPFVGTTVGLYNYIYFYLFLVSFCLMEGGFISAWIMFLIRSERFPKGIFLMGLYLALYIVPVLMMACYHSTLVLGNVSTNEQLNARKYRYLWDGESGRLRNSFDQGKVRNVLQRCWPDRSSYELGWSSGGDGAELGAAARREDEERQSLKNDVV